MSISNGVALAQSVATIKGLSNAENPKVNIAIYDTKTYPKRKDLEKEVQGKDVLKILALANSNSVHDIHKALVYADIAMALANKNNNDREKYDVLRDIGIIYEDNNQKLNAIKYYNEALVVAERLTDNDRFTIMNDLAISNRSAGNFKEAKDINMKALEMAISVRDSENIEYNFHGLGMVYREGGDYNQAVEYFLKSLSIAQARNSQIGIIDGYQDIAKTFISSKNNEKALENIEKAYQLAQNLKGEDAQYKLAKVTNDYGKILFSVGATEQALQKHKESLAIFKKLGYRNYIAESLKDIAAIYTLRHEYKEAEDALLEALTHRDYIYMQEYAELYNTVGEFYWQKKEIVKAEDAFRKSLKISEKHHLMAISQQNYYALYKIYRLKNNPNQALSFLEIANTLNDSLFNTEKVQGLRELQFRFDIEKSEKEIQALRASENALRASENESRTKNTRTFLVASILFFTLISSSLVYFLYQRGKNNASLKQKNQEIQLQNRKLEESNEILQQFAYVSAHDLKEPLRNIGSFVSLIQRKYGKQLPEEAGEYMKYVITGVKRMNNLLEDLLDYSSLLSQQASHDPIDAKEVVKEICENFRTMIGEKNATINIADDFPMVAMNRLHLLQLFQNLIGNGLKFCTTNPEINIKAREENETLIISVADNGIGIKQEYTEKVFTLFHQLHRHKYEGTGIGLTICKNIVDKYNGRIWFESEEGHGTTFFIKLPLTAKND